MSLLSDKYAAEAKSKPQDVKYDTFTEHGLGDKYKSKKEPNHSAANEVKRLNKRLEAINAPFYAVCKDDGKIGYRKVKPSCDADHPNVTYARKKTVDEALKIEAVIEADEKDEKKGMEKEKPAEKPSEKQDKPVGATFLQALKIKYPAEVNEFGLTKATRYQDNYGSDIHVMSKKYIDLEFNGKILRFANKYFAPDYITSVTQLNPDGKTMRKRDEPSEKEHEKPKQDDRDAKSAKILEMIEAKFNKILESKG